MGLVGQSRFGYLLKDRVLDVDEFLDVLERVAGGWIRARSGGGVAGCWPVTQPDDPAEPLTERETEVLGLMAQGWTNAGNRASPVAHRTDGRKSRPVDPWQTRRLGRGGRPPAGACRADLPRGTSSLLSIGALSLGLAHG